jgi:exosome complex exonuclease DIS3/RRP44
MLDRIFMKKNRRGNVLKIVREHYLRDDLSCGSKLCTSLVCSAPQQQKTTSDIDRSQLILDASPILNSSLIKHPHYIIPDTNIILHQMDVLEDPIFTNVIICQTVLQEVKQRSISCYQRVTQLIGSLERKFFCFVNEFHKDVYVKRFDKETANDRNDRAIREVCKYYSKHLSNTVKIVLLSDDVENRRLAKGDNILAFSCRQYVESLNKPELVDRIAAKEEQDSELNEKKITDSTLKNKQIIFPEHMRMVDIQAGIKAGRLYQGTFQSSRENYLEANVFLYDNEKYPQVFIQGYRNLNRAVHEDIVAVELLPESEWATPTSLILEEVEEDVGDYVNEKEEEEQIINKPDVRKLPSGRIVGIIKRNWRPYCGILQVSDLPDATRHLFVPTEKRIPKVRVETRQANQIKNQRILVNIDCWPRDSRYPLGHFVRSLGEIGDKDTENQVLLLEHDVPNYPFPSAVLDCLPTLPWIISEEEKKKRLDLTHLSICSVDPPGCTDIDDALHCIVLPNGNYQCGVHIADVGHFIRPHTAIDEEARRRSTTVYLVDQRIDMVPALLSSNLCSLRDDGARFAFTVLWEIDPNDAKIVKTEFHKSIIYSKASLTYAQAQMMIDDKSRSDDLTEGLRRLNNIAKILKAKRIEKGALSLASSEIRFSLDSETHDPIDVITKELKETNSMVEEFMLLANITVAQKLYDTFPQCACLRRHPSPPISNFDPLIKAAESKGFQIKCETGKELADSLELAHCKDNLFFNTMIRMLTTRCMMQALYFCSGLFPQEEFHHYGLAAPIYTHFTSPIRRYADILVHRLLAAAINADSTYPQLLDKQYLQQTCNHMNYRHKMAQYAGRASVDLHTQLFFRNRKVDEEAYILGVKKNALQVLIPQYGLEGTLYFKDFPFVYNEEVGIISFLKRILFLFIIFQN